MRNKNGIQLFELVDFFTHHLKIVMHCFFLFNSSNCCCFVFASN